MFKTVIQFAVEKPKVVIAVTVAAVFLALIQFPRIKVDTDPENMLPADAPVRVFHRGVKKEFSIYDMIVIGITNEKNPNGVFNVGTLGRIHRMTREIQEIDGVVANEVIGLSTKDNIEQAGVGAVSFNWLMPEPPQTQEQALKIREEAFHHPMFRGSVVSDDGKALALYIPIVRKDISYEVAQKIRNIFDQYKGEEDFYLTGLPVANDQFGVEMFKQMAVSAPLAGAVIFGLMWWFFKSLVLIIAPMILAIAVVIITMGLLIGLGFPVHIMSSMIPIFLMPIAVLDSIHILSEFFDRYPSLNDKGKTILAVMKELFTPMLFTSLTSVAGFFSLSFSPIPPVQVFGVFVALGVAIAWILTMLFIPAYIMLLKEKSFRHFDLQQEEEGSDFLNRTLSLFKSVTLKQPKLALTVTGILIIVSIYGILKINVNDNPVRWFNRQHPIRIADRVLNKHFAGTYEAYLVLEAQDHENEIFLQPEMLRYVEDLEQFMVESKLAGKSTALPDIVKKIYYELLGGNPADGKIPDSKEAVAQTLISYENSHRPDDLWHLVTPDYSKLNLWIQLKSGDNQDMAGFVKKVETYMKENPPPFPVKSDWAGLTYINVIWQNNMVWGMLYNFLGSFIIVLFMMLFLFRSSVKAMISMIPLSVTILLIYSLLGFLGKDYDMPVAVLSALTLGLSVDFSIHFIERAMAVNKKTGAWSQTADEMFKGPGRAIVRNALVVAIGFLPLLAAPLVPYKTVGFFMFMIMAVSGIAALFILPAIVTVSPKLIFEKENKAGCKCAHCLLTGFFVAVSVAYVLFGFNVRKWTLMTFITIGVIVFSSVLCYFASKSARCFSEEE
ncbi:MAG: MMPL family transporter [Candidatus Omnitrophota bacterium]